MVRFRDRTERIIRFGDGTVSARQLDFGEAIRLVARARGVWVGIGIVMLRWTSKWGLATQSAARARVVMVLGICEIVVLVMLGERRGDMSSVVGSSCGLLCGRCCWM